MFLPLNFFLILFFRVTELQRENSILNEENDKDRQLLTVIRGHFDDMKKKFEE
jgi:hypothetical protein